MINTTWSTRILTLWRPDRTFWGTLRTFWSFDIKVKNFQRHPLRNKCLRKGEQLRERKRPANRKLTHTSRSPLSWPSIVNLPLDIILSILELLRNPRDLRALLQVLPRWDRMIPSRYWRSRIINDYMLRPEHVPTADELEWEAAYFRIRNYLEKGSPGRVNRQRIMPLLEAKKTLFFLFLEYVRKLQEAAI